MVVGGAYVQYGPNGEGYRLNTYSARSADVALRNAQVKVNGYSVYTYDLNDTNGKVSKGHSANEINESISDVLGNAAKKGVIEQEALKGYDKKEYAKMYSNDIYTDVNGIPFDLLHVCVSAITANGGIDAAVFDAFKQS